MSKSDQDEIREATADYVRRNSKAKITGNIERGEPEDEREHFYICSVCKQAVDMRDLGHVFDHEERRTHLRRPRD